MARPFTVTFAPAPRNEQPVSGRKITTLAIAVYNQTPARHCASDPVCAATPPPLIVGIVTVCAPEPETVITVALLPPDPPAAGFETFTGPDPPVMLTCATLLAVFREKLPTFNT